MSGTIPRKREWVCHFIWSFFPSLSSQAFFSFQICPYHKWGLSPWMRVIRPPHVMTKIGITCGCLGFMLNLGWSCYPSRLRARLVRSNGYYTVIGISITRNKISCNVIIITNHLFGDNTNKILNLYSIFYYNIINIQVLLIIRVLIN